MSKLLPDFDLLNRIVVQVIYSRIMFDINCDIQRVL